MLLVNAPAGAPVETVHLFVNDESELTQHLASASSQVSDTGNLLISYPKGQAGLHRDTLWAAARPAGWEGVSLVSVDDKWSAMRFKRAA